MCLQIRVLNGATAPASTAISLLTLCALNALNGTQVTLAIDKVVDLPQSVAITGTPTFTAVGAAAQDAAVSGNPTLVASRLEHSNPAAMSASGDAVRQIANMIGVPAKPSIRAIPESTGNMLPLLVVSLTQRMLAIKATAAAGIRNYLTSLTVQDARIRGY